MATQQCACRLLPEMQSVAFAVLPRFAGSAFARLEPAAVTHVAKPFVPNGH